MHRPHVGLEIVTYRLTTKLADEVIRGLFCGIPKKYVGRSARLLVAKR